MEGGGFFPFGGGDPEELLGALRDFAERQAESVQEAYFVMDSVFLSEAERQTIQLRFGPNRLTIAELLGWVEQFTAEEGPRVIREAGKDGVVALVYNPALSDRIPAEAKARVDAAQRDILAGTLVVPSAEF